jgi:uncharacterized protein YeaO (DUF488 family)
MLRIKRIYDPPAPEDGRRVLVDRLWPRGLAKEAVLIDEWLKEIAPSNGLRKWFGHDPAKWEEFRQRYFEELQGQKEALEHLQAEAKKGNVSLLYSARDAEHNNAAALRELLVNSLD